MRDTIIPGGGRLDPPSREAKIAGERVVPLWDVVEYGRSRVSHIPSLLMRTFEEGAWRSFSLPQGRTVYAFPTFQAFIEDFLMITPGELKATCEFAAGIHEKGGRRSGNPEDDQKAIALLAEIVAQTKPSATADQGMTYMDADHLRCQALTVLMNRLALADTDQNLDLCNEILDQLEPILWAYRPGTAWQVEGEA